MVNSSGEKLFVPCMARTVPEEPLKSVVSLAFSVSPFTG
jgi:hypothetical protein